jgi:hypothetical protein
MIDEIMAHLALEQAPAAKGRATEAFGRPVDLVSVSV